MFTDQSINTTDTVRHHRTLSGFTMIELLTAIGIIAVLAAILLPVFSAARSKARQTSCLSNLRQLSTAITVYRQDNDQVFPYWDFNASSKTGTKTPNHLESLWFNAIYPYAKNAGIYRCPSANDDRTLRQNSVFGWIDTANFDTAGIVDALKDVPINYGMSEMLSKGTACNDKGACSDSGIDRPTESLLIADCSQALTNDLGDRPNRALPSDPRHSFIITRVAYANAPLNCFDDPLACGAARSGSLQDLGQRASTYESSQTRHDRGSNISYIDGHVKWLHSSQITYDLFAGDGHP